MCILSLPQWHNLYLAKLTSWTVSLSIFQKERYQLPYLIFLLGSSQYYSWWCLFALWRPQYAQNTGTHCQGPQKDVPISTGTPSNSFSDSLVVLLLQSRHFHPEDLLHFGWQRFLHILLHSAQQERLQDFVKALVAILSAFPVILLKILPELKPGNTKEEKGGVRIPLVLGHQTASVGYTPAAPKTGDQQFNGNTVENNRFTLLWLTEGIAGKARRSLGLDTFLTSYIWAPHSGGQCGGPLHSQDPKSQVSHYFILLAFTWQQFLNFPRCLPQAQLWKLDCFTLLWRLFWDCCFLWQLLWNVEIRSPSLGKPQASPSLFLWSNKNNLGETALLASNIISVIFGAYLP